MSGALSSTEKQKALTNMLLTFRAELEQCALPVSPRETERASKHQLKTLIKRPVKMADNILQIF